jgi:glycosyltransferase involved in cell wall biosynthesis
MTKPKVYLTGGDGIGWALDEDLRLTRQALQGLVEFSDLQTCEVVHSVWWEPLLSIAPAILSTKRIVCHLSGEPFRYLCLPRYRHVMGAVDRWISQTQQAARQCTAVGLPHSCIPYTTDVDSFHRLPAGHEALQAMRSRWQIPDNRYLIGSFHRDSAGFDLRIPKIVKGPDVLAEIAQALHRRGCPVHVVLAGPRRHWIRQRLDEGGVPYTFVGDITEGDDYAQNFLPRETLNLLYNLLDLYLVTSRSEGGPRSLMEAASAKCKVLSTPVGLAGDLLDPACIYSSPIEAVGLIERDLVDNRLQGTVRGQYERVLARHRPEVVAPLYGDFYRNLAAAPLPRRSVQSVSIPPVEAPRPPQTLVRRLRSLLKQDRLRVGLWHRFFAPPYGGGNQFMLALRDALRRRGVTIVENQLRDDVDVYLLNSIHFDVERFLEFSHGHPLRAVHRIDGPIHLIRGFDREKDELCFELNKRFAAATVLQSTWTYRRITEMGYQPIKPVIVRNAVNSAIFHRHGRLPFDSSRKVRLIATSWSNNARKGGPIYKWLEERLDWDRFEFTFVGNASVPFDRIRNIPAVPSAALAQILCQHDIYITASQNDPCSNALIEAMACGLPVLYRNDGGHPELVGYGGLPFTDEKEIVPRLEQIAANYEMFQRLITVPTMDDVADTYLTLLKDAAASPCAANSTQDDPTGILVAGGNRHGLG